MFFIWTAKADLTGTMTRPACIVVGAHVVFCNSHTLGQHWILDMFFSMPKQLKHYLGDLKEKTRHLLCKLCTVFKRQ